MRFDGCDRREELRGHLAVRLPCRRKRRDAPFGARQLAVTPRTRPCPSQFLLGALDPERRSELEENGFGGFKLLGRAASLAQTAQRIAGDEQRSTPVEPKTGGLEPVDRLLRS